MPEITEADREAAIDAANACCELIEHRYGERVRISMDEFRAVIAPHITTAAEAAKGEATRSERERIVEKLNAHVGVLLSKNAAYAAVGLQDYIEEISAAITPAPPPTPLTADAVKRMLPAQYDEPDYKQAKYDGEFGSIEWIEDASGFGLYINEEKRCEVSSLTDHKLAKLIEALGVTTVQELRVVINWIER